MRDLNTTKIQFFFGNIDLGKQQSNSYPYSFMCNTNHDKEANFTLYLQSSPPDIIRLLFTFHETFNIKPS